MTDNDKWFAKQKKITEWEHTVLYIMICVAGKVLHLQVIDAGVMLNMPYPPFLGEKRDVDLLIALGYGYDTIKVRCV